MTGAKASAGRGRLEVILAALCFSTGGAAIKATALSGFQVASFRSGVAALAMLLLVPAARARWSWRALAVGLAYATTMVLFVSANKLTTAANTIFLQSSAPLYVLLLSVLVLKERVRQSDLSYMLVLAGGLALFFVGVRAPDQLAPSPLLGNALALSAGLSWAMTVFGLRWIEQREPERGGSRAVLLGNLIAFSAVLPWALPVGAAGLKDAAVIAYLGLIQIGLAYVLLMRAVQHVPALEASLLLLVEPVLSPLWAWLVHGEAPGGWAIAGGAVILGATAVRTTLDARRERRLRDLGRGARQA
ncbi:MAG: EamA family transporter [Myxococcales bacterium]|nr:EamA family transporter [Myxococcales bacterium]